MGIAEHRGVDGFRLGAFWDDTLLDIGEWDFN